MRGAFWPDLGKKYASLWAGWQTPVIVNIMGNDADELANLAQQLEEIEGVADIHDLIGAAL